MKNGRWIYGILALSLVFSISSCVFYKTVELSDTSAESIKNIGSEKQYITLQNSDESQVYLIDNAQWGDDEISGEVKPLKNTDHPGNSGMSSGAKGKASKSYLHLYTSSEITSGPSTLRYGDIFKAKTHKNATGVSFLATGAIVVVGAVAAVFTFLAIACSCPHVAVIRPDGSQEFQGSLFPGSIFKSLKRKDYLVMNNVVPDEKGEVTVQVFNELDEIQYIDKVELLAVSHDRERLGILNNEDLVAYDKGVLPRTAVSQMKNDALASVLKRDNDTYEFNDPSLDKGLNSLELSFNASEMGDKPLLIIRGGQTELLEHTAEVFFQQFGTKFPEWVSSMNEKDPENYRENAVEQGISLNAYVMKDGEWIYQGSFENAGAMAMRDLAIPLNIQDLGGEIRVKLETAFGFWKVDQVSLTSDWMTDMEMERLDLISATNQDGDDVTSLIDRTDETYSVHELKGSSTDLKYKASTTSDVDYVLSGTGYYNHVRNYTAAPNKKFLRKMRKTKNSTHLLAQKVQMYKDTHLASN